MELLFPIETLLPKLLPFPMTVFVELFTPILDEVMVEQRKTVEVLWTNNRLKELNPHHPKE